MGFGRVGGGKNKVCISAVLSRMLSNWIDRRRVSKCRGLWRSRQLDTEDG